MAKPKSKKPSAPTTTLLRPPRPPSRDESSEFDRAVSALFQVPKDAITSTSGAKKRKSKG